MVGVNKVILIGNLGAKSEMKVTQTDVSVINLEIATTEYSGSDELRNRREYTELHNVTAFRKLAEICNQYLNEGAKVYIEGQLRTNKWTDPNNVTKYLTEIVAGNLLILSLKGQRDSIGDTPYDVPDDFGGSSSASLPSGAASAQSMEDVGVNKVILIGNLGAKPEMKYTQSGVPVTKLNIATTEYAGKDERGNRMEHTEWHRVTAWRKLAEFCNQYLDKGTQVFIEGRLRTSKWTGQDNIERSSTEISMNNMQILSSKGSRLSASTSDSYDVPDNFSGSSNASFPSGATGAQGVEDIDFDDDLDENFL